MESSLQADESSLGHAQYVDLEESNSAIVPWHRLLPEIPATTRLTLAAPRRACWWTGATWTACDGGAQPTSLLLSDYMFKPRPRDRDRVRGRTQDGGVGGVSYSSSACLTTPHGPHQPARASARGPRPIHIRSTRTSALHGLRRARPAFPDALARPPADSLSNGRSGKPAAGAANTLHAGARPGLLQRCYRPSMRTAALARDPEAEAPTGAESCLVSELVARRAAVSP